MTERILRTVNGTVVSDTATDPAVVSTAAQNAATVALLAGAQALIDDLRSVKAVNLANAKAALVAAHSASLLPANPTAAQLATALRAVDSYLLVSDASITAVGADLIQVVIALGNRIARDAGSTTVLS